MSSGIRKDPGEECIDEPTWRVYIYIYIYIYMCVCVCVCVCVSVRACVRRTHDAEKSMPKIWLASMAIPKEECKGAVMFVVLCIDA